MSAAPKIPDLPQVDLDPNQLRRFLELLREIVQTREGRRGNPLDRAITFRDLADLGLAMQQGTGWVGTGGGTPGPQGDPGPAGPPGTPYVPDYTPPPTPTGLTTVSMFRGIYIEWDPPTYTQGHGNAYTKVYIAQYGGSGPLPTFAGATAAGQAGGTTSMYMHNAAIGAQLHVWLTFMSVDGVESPTPAGGLNGFQITVGRVGNADLGDLIVEAANLANGSVTAAKVLDQAITAAKLNVAIGGGNLLPNSAFKAVSTLTVPGRFGWETYNNALTAVTYELGTGGLFNCNYLRVIADASTTQSLGIYTRTSIPGGGGVRTWTPGLTYTISFWGRAASAGMVGLALEARYSNMGWVSTEVVAQPALVLTEWRRYVFRVVPADNAQTPFGELFISWLVSGTLPAGAAYDLCGVQVEYGEIATAYAPRPDEILPGTITTTEIADDAVTTPKLIAGSVVAAKIAADAVEADKIKAGAVLASKLLIRPASIFVDPFAQDAAFWARDTGWGFDAHPGGIASALGVPNALTCSLAGGTGRRHATSGKFALSPGRDYLVRWKWRSSGSGLTWVLGVNYFDAAGSLITASYSGGMVADDVTVNGSLSITTPAGTALASLVLFNDETGTADSGWFAAADFRISERATADLIVDGSILAEKLAANSIAVGSAAIQDGAIRNALIENLAVDEAKLALASVSTAKIADAAITNAKIANAAIDSAKIGDLQVTTAKIGNNAVTVPSGSALASDFALTSGIESTVLSFNIDTAGQPLYVAWTARIYSNSGIARATATGKAIAPSGTTTVVCPRSFPVDGLYGYDESISGSLYVPSPGIGTTEVRLLVQITTDAPSPVCRGSGATTLFAIGVKK